MPPKTLTGLYGSSTYGSSTAVHDDSCLVNPPLTLNSLQCRTSNLLIVASQQPFTPIFHSFYDLPANPFFFLPSTAFPSTDHHSLGTLPTIMGSPSQPTIRGMDRGLNGIKLFFIQRRKWRVYPIILVALASFRHACVRACSVFC